MNWLRSTSKYSKYKIESDVTGKIPNAIEMNQFVFQKSALVKAKYRAVKMQKEGKILLSIDVHNAYNAIPIELINNVLENAGVNPILHNYLLTYLKSRYCRLDMGDNSFIEMPSSGASVG